MSKKNFNTNFFLEKTHFQKAFELVKLQLENKNNSFKTLELEIYRNLDILKTFDVDDYYKKYIKKDIFYNHVDKFYNISYLIPKGFYGVRNFNFLSFEMLILYYALGFYLHDLINESFKTIEEKKDNRDNINTYYGGKINFGTPKNSDLYYLKDYIHFNQSVNGQIKDILSKRKKAIVIKLDIQDYFKSVDFDILIEILEKYSVPSNRKTHNFDQTTIQEIKNLFLFINKNKIGLPLFSQNIISNFLSYIYLYELDNYIQNLDVAKEKEFIYARYVDDFYLIYKRNKGLKNDFIGNEIFEISTGISKFLASELNLKINNLKSQELIISDQDDFDKFIKKEKVVSLPENEEEDEKTPQEKLKEILNIIRKLKKDYKSYGKAYINTDGNNKLNDIFSNNLKNYSNSTTAKKEIDKVFKDWNPILTLANTSTLTFLIKLSSSNSEFKKFLFEQNESNFQNPQYLYLLEKFILNNNLKESDKQKIIEIKRNNSYLELIKKVLDSDYKMALPSNFNLNIRNKDLKTYDSMCQQLKMLVLAETEQKFNLAFNHLLNIFHLHCFEFDKNKNDKKLKNYNQNSVTNYLDDLGLSIEYINFSIQFFNRRNKNNISHPGEKEMENWTVDKEEYLKFKLKLNDVFGKIENSL